MHTDQPDQEQRRFPELHGPALLASVLLERNRWAPGKIPTYRVSEWISRIKAAGFEGLELWENHVFLADEEEKAALEHAAGILPIKVFSSYASLDESGVQSRELAAHECARLGIPCVKFNFGSDPDRRHQYVGAVKSWCEKLPPGTMLLCECHAGTIAENPEEAAALLEELDPARVGAIVHPFVSPIQSLKDSFRCYGTRVAHAHLQLRESDGRLQLLEDHPASVGNALGVMCEFGYQGSYALEFTAGTGDADERIDQMLQSAQRDLRYFRAMTSQEGSSTVAAPGNGRETPCND